MDREHKLQEGDTVVYRIYVKGFPLYRDEGVFEVNVQVVEVLHFNLYRVKPISGHGCKVVSITDLFY